MYGALVLFDDEFIHIVAISFTALILTELLMVALTARSWHVLMILGELVSLGIYVIALAVLHDFFGTRKPAFYPRIFRFFLNIFLSLHRLAVHLDVGLLLEGHSDHAHLLPAFVHSEIPPQKVLAAELFQADLTASHPTNTHTPIHTHLHTQRTPCLGLGSSTSAYP